MILGMYHDQCHLGLAFALIGFNQFGLYGMGSLPRVGGLEQQGIRFAELASTSLTQGLETETARLARADA